MKYFFIAVLLIVGWNIFLIQRDRQLFDAYRGTMTVELTNPDKSFKIAK